MTLAELLAKLPPKGLEDIPFPRALLGAFRRRSITFCTGLTDETTIVYWFQSRRFTIDLRLPDAADTPVTERQGWIGDTLWDAGIGQLSWAIDTSYQPHNQWPEPARLVFIGNSIIEFAPSGAYVEDWRQQSFAGPFLGLRLIAMRNELTGEEVPMDGGLILAGDHAAYAQSRLPTAQQAISDGIATQADIASYEVSVANNGPMVTHSTQPERRGQPIVSGDFTIAPDGHILLTKPMGGTDCTLRFAVDIYVPDFAFDRQTAATAEALHWMEREKSHLTRNAVILG